MIRLGRASSWPVDLAGAAKRCFHEMRALACEQHVFSKGVAHIRIKWHCLLPWNNARVRQRSSRQEVVDTKPSDKMKKLQKFLLSFREHGTNRIHDQHSKIRNVYDYGSSYYVLYVGSIHDSATRRELVLALICLPECLRWLRFPFEELLF